jgi:hypothetical protein
LQSEYSKIKNEFLISEEDRVDILKPFGPLEILENLKIFGVLKIMAQIGHLVIECTP